MDSLSDYRKNYHIYRVVLSFLGLWPCRNRRPQYPNNVVFILILCLTCISQIAALTRDTPTHILLKNISHVLITLVALVKYLSSLKNLSNLEILMATIESDWEDIRSEQELNIFKEHANEGRNFTIMFAVWITLPAIAIVTDASFNTVLNFVCPRDEPLQFPITMHYFFDKQRYFYLDSMIVSVSYVVSSITFIGTEALSILAVQHVTNLFALTRYRIRECFDPDAKFYSASKKHMTSVADSVISHNRALNFFQTYKDNLARPYILLLGLGISVLSISMYRLSSAYELEHSVDEAVTSALLCTAILGYMFYINYVVQVMINENNNIFTELYDTKWTDLPVSVRKILWFLMVNTTKDCNVEICGLYNASIEGFSKMARTSISYFVVLHSYRSA